MPRRAIISALAVLLGPVLLIHGYTRIGVTVLENKVTEEKLPAEFSVPAGMLPSWAPAPPKTQKITTEVARVISEGAAIVRVTSGTIARSDDGKLRISEAKPGAARCPT